jgi:hypothetical protein
MSSLFTILLLLGMSAPALAQGSPKPCATAACTRPAPAPFMGAGLAALPVLLIGGGVYWIVRRKKTPAS